MWSAGFRRAQPLAATAAMKQKTQIPHLITRRQLTERWQCSPATVKRRERVGALPVVTLGGNRARYLVADVEAYETATSYRH